MAVTYREKLIGENGITLLEVTANKPEELQRKMDDLLSKVAYEEGVDVPPTARIEIHRQSSILGLRFGKDVIIG